MNKLLLAAALALAPAAAPAQAPTSPAAPAPLADADPAMWVVRDDDTIIYLFGTIHLLDDRPWFNDEVRTAFDASDEVVLEAILPDNPAEIMPLVQRYAVDAQGRKLSDRLTAEQNAALNAALATVGAPAGAFDSFEPWFVSMTLTAVAAQQLGLNAANGPEGVLIRAARERNVPVAELEGLEWQVRMFDGMPDAQQLAYLREALDNFAEMRAKLTPMLAAWSTGDVERLQEIVADEGDRDPGLYRILFTDRNTNWAGWIQERLARPGTVFLAVGAAHLAGPDSVQAALRTRGIGTERVPHVEAEATPAS
ncbi:MAG: TraB/GumN family protein [Allosphingosinicella sp.]